jgi:hypothetical protein
MTEEEIRDGLLSAGPSLLPTISEVFKSKSAEIVKVLYSPNAKLSIGSMNIQTAERIANEVLKRNTELVFMSCSTVFTKPNRLLITGTCLWENETRFFTLALEATVRANGESEVLIANHVISQHKI